MIDGTEPTLHLGPLRDGSAMGPDGLTSKRLQGFVVNRMALEPYRLPKPMTGNELWINDTCHAERPQLSSASWTLA